MSELQLGLLGAGILAIAGVWLYNLLQERRHRRKAQQLFSGQQPDVLLANATSESAVGGRIEPMLRDAGESGMGGAATEIVESGSGGIAPLAEATGPGDADRDNPFAPWADPLADCIVSFDAPQAVSASTIRALQSALSGRIGKSLVWLARERRTEVWRPIGDAEKGAFSHWAAALQLADRRGAISDAEIGAFLEGMRSLGGQLGVAIPMSDHDEIAQRAQALDEFCASVDIQFGVHVVEARGGAFSGTRLRGVCEAAGLALGDDGRFHARDAAGHGEFSIANIGPERFDDGNIDALATPGVALTIDVPRVARGAEVYDRLLAMARLLARGLGGVLVDVQRAPLPESTMDGIRAKIVELQDAMRAAGIPPGGPLALKLFS